MDGLTSDAMACRIEEAEFPARLLDRARRRGGAGTLLQKGAHIDDRQSFCHYLCLMFAITMRSYRLTSGMSAGGLGISSPESVSVGPEGFVCVA